MKCAEYKVGEWYAVTWLDAYTGTDVDWHMSKDVRAGDLPMITAGRCCKVTRNYVNLVQTWNAESKSFFHQTAIPFGMITKSKRLKP